MKKYAVTLEHQKYPHYTFVLIISCQKRSDVVPEIDRFLAMEEHSIKDFNLNYELLNEDENGVIFSKFIYQEVN
jgi:hypothetical protein